MSKNILPNKDGIKSHLDFLFKDQTAGKIEIAYTPPDSGAVCHAEYFNINQINDAAEFAYNKNAQEGVNVYVGAALRKDETAPFGRSSSKDYYYSTSIWCDLDDANAAREAKDKYKDMPPSLVVVTGRHPELRAQVWWRLDTPEHDPIEHKKTLANVCAALNGDKAVVDPARVMRLGGSIAWPKKDGRILELTEIITPQNATQSVSKEAFHLYFPVVDLPLTRPTIGGVDHVPSLQMHTKEEWSIDQVCDMLNHIHPDGQYMDWVSVGMALKDYGVSFDIWDAWSSKGTKYPGSKELYKKWQSFKGRGISIGSLYYHAHNGGYHPSKYNQVILPQKTPMEAFDPETGEILPDKQNPINELTSGQGERVLPLIYADDVTPITETSDFIENLLCENQFSVIYGESNCGKTFFMMDLALHVALGKEWRGREVSQGGVIYAALEGGYNTRNRICAFKQFNELTGQIPLAIIPSGINLLDPKGDIPAFITAIKHAKDRLGSVKMIIIDTLSRALSGGDENASTDMGQLIIHADYIRAITGAHISFVHHCGKDKANGARGHSSLRAAVDTEIEISRDDEHSPSKIKVVKQREMETGEEMYFTLKQVELGINNRLKPITSCVVLPTDAIESKKDITLNAAQLFIYDAIVATMDRYGKDRSVDHRMPSVYSVLYEEFADVLTERGYKEIEPTEKKSKSELVKTSTLAARLSLKKMGKINFNKTYIWIN